MKAPENLRDELIAFLRSNAPHVRLADGRQLTRIVAGQLLQSLIEPQIEVRNVCPAGRGIVVAAPHVSFDHWSEYFCNRAAAHLNVGRVVAKHFRDQDSLHIPVSIGRHIHVNRPMESAGPGQPEKETVRARESYEQYVSALREAGGGIWPLRLLIECHSHKQTPHIEIATRGLHMSSADALHDAWRALREERPELPELLIEPLHRLKFAANAAKRHGALQGSVCERALHIEIPRAARKTEDLRQLANGQLLQFLDAALAHLNL